MLLNDWCMRAQIEDQAMEHIHSNEVILTSGYSVTVHNFLKAVGFPLLPTCSNKLIFRFDLSKSTE